tara:strand:+ start:118 stop:291 length:174 start_codon:yes stop_codon:yes gene_type:complete
MSKGGSDYFYKIREICNKYYIELEKGNYELIVVIEMHKRQIEWVKTKLKLLIMGLSG